MKALVVVKAGAENGGNSGIDIRVLRASLAAIGVEYDMALVTNLPSIAVVNAYDFIAIPTMASGFDTMVDNASITIPMFGMGATGGSGAFGASSGVSSGATTNQQRFLDVPFTSQSFIASFGNIYTLNTSNGKALCTVSATEPNEGSFTGTAQTNPGTVMGWRNATAGGNYLYASGHNPPNAAYLPFLIAEAIKDGKISASGIPRKAPFCFQIDHINGQPVVDDPTILDKIASYVPGDGVLWTGIANSNVNFFQNLPQNVIDKLKQYSGNQFKYSWHDHVFNPLIAQNLDANGYSTDWTKTQLDTQYQGDKLIWEGHGLVLHEGCFVPGSDSWDENMVELYSRNVSIMSSPLNDTTQAGYGARCFRTTAAKSSRKLPAKDLIYHNQHAIINKVRGIQIFDTWDLADNASMPYNAVADWRKNFNWVCNGISMASLLYLHEEDFIAADQSPGTTGKQHGYVQMQMIVDMCTYLSDVVKLFADPIDYID